MGQFIVSALKYRPDTFASLIGQDNIVKTLQNSIIRGQLAHAYLFCGPRGVGKTTAARIFAKSINCLNPNENMEPCGKCESCLSFSEGRSYCIQELDAASNNSVDDIRNLADMVRIPPQIGKYSVYIIDEVHMLSSSAFNAFLKTLEEPPSHAIFILATTEKHKILPTILSRCQTYDFNRILIPDMVKNMKIIAEKEEINIDEESLHIIAVKGDGSMRDALTLFDQIVAFCGKEIKYEEVIENLNVLDYDYYFKIVENSLKGDYMNSLLIFDEILSKGFNALYFISGLSSHLRDLIVCRHSSGDTLLSLSPALIERYKKQSSGCSLRFLYKALNITTNCEAGYRMSGNQRLHIEFALMKLAEQTFIQSSTIDRKTDGQQSAKTATHKTAPSVTDNIPTTDRTVQATDKNAAINSAPAKTDITTPAATINAETSTSETRTITAGKPETPTSPTLSTGISLKQMLRKAKENELKQNANTDNLLDEDVTEEGIRQAWKEVAESEKQSGRKSLGTALTLHELKISMETKTLTCYVSNIAQRDWIREKVLMQIEKKLRNILRNNKIKVEIDVSDSANPQSRMPYMPTDKANYILANNEEIRKLRNDLDLDIK